MALEPADDVRELNDVRALSALANAHRARMIDLLTTRASATTTQLSQDLGIATGSVSHHLKVLVEAGLVEAAPDLAEDQRERRWRLVTRGHRWTRSDLTHSPAAASAGLSAELLAASQQYERTREWLESDDDLEWADAAFTGKYWLELSSEELVELSTQIDELMLRWRRRDIPEDGADRRHVLGLIRAFPSTP